MIEHTTKMMTLNLIFKAVPAQNYNKIGYLLTEIYLLLWGQQKLTWTIIKGLDFRGYGKHNHLSRIIMKFLQYKA